MSLFTEFGNEGNIARIIGMEVLTHWYLLVLLIVMIWSMWKLFRNPGRRPAQPLRHYYLGNTLRLGFWVAFFHLRRSRLYLLIGDAPDRRRLRPAVRHQSRGRGPCAEHPFRHPAHHRVLPRQITGILQ